MTSHHQHRIDRETVERLLDGTAVDRRQVPDDLVRLLDAVRAAPLPEELRGEHRAVRAFHTARRTPARRPSPRPVRQGALARLLPAKTIAALAIAATGGMALATVQGAMPEPLRPVPPATTTPVDGPSGGIPEPVRTAPTHGPPGGGPRAPELVPSCRSWRDARAIDPERALRDPAFAPLLRAAGGRDEVDAWCETVLGGRRTPGPSAGAPSAGPSAGPDRPAPPPARPTGQPAVPSVNPARPTGQPAVPTPPVGDVPGRPGTTADPSEPTADPSEPVGALPEPTEPGGGPAGR
ncbi:hypothetical protein ACIBJE_02885 [Micromonospora sp. NPDC050187]|uniref:hypothetical protein n=1 Tax=Micromonospora sp. NPDC050187 TaxID=3364277 RepID=UPI0037900D0C